MNTQQKYESLKKILRQLGKIAIAYSGGVDSTFLLKAAVDTIGSENVLACLATSPSLAQSQYKQAVELAALIGANLRTVPLGELEDKLYSANKADRCFHCKSHLYKLLLDLAKENNFDHVLCGSNFDDKDDFRPGTRAAELFHIRSPLLEAELTKSDIRALSRQLDLPTADLPASPCLASRIAYNLEITPERLNQIEQAENFLRQLGFIEFRVRHHDQIARIEVETDDIAKLSADPLRTKITEKLKSLGFKYVTVDLQGFRSGSLNELLAKEEKHQSP